MVNTFITRKKKISGKYFPDYSSSAKDLDTLRLRKQCVEATQILNILQQVNQVIEWEGWSPLTSATLKEQLMSPQEQAKIYTSRISSYLNVVRRYLSLDYRYVILENRLEKRDKNYLPFRIYKNDRYILNGDNTVTVWLSPSQLKKANKYKTLDETDYDLSAGKRCRTKKPKVFSRYDVALPSDTIFSLSGFSRHAITKMWVGYEESLKIYITKHIDVYQKLRKKNGDKCSMNLPRYPSLKIRDVPHPWWIVNTYMIIYSHRASLLRKEPKHYSSIQWKLHSKWRKRGYVWTGDMNEETLTKIISHKNIYLGDICSLNKIVIE